MYLGSLSPQNFEDKLMLFDNLLIHLYQLYSTNMQKYTANYWQNCSQLPQGVDLIRFCQYTRS